MISNLKAILFDLDGTLLDSAPNLGLAADKMRQTRQMPSLDYSEYRPYAGAGARGMIKVALGHTPDHPEFEAMREEFFKNYESDLISLTHPFVDVPNVLLSLQSNQFKWGIVTNKSQRFTTPLVKQYSILANASAVISGDTTPHSKPHPAPLLEAAKRIGISPNECMFVGDDERDVQAGRAAGMLTVAASYGYLSGSKNVSHWRADFEIDSPIELLKILKLH